MLKIMQFAHKKGREEGREEGIIEAAREMVIEALQESLGIVPARIADRVMTVSRTDMLKALLRQAMKCKAPEDFEKMLDLAAEKNAA